MRVPISFRLASAPQSHTPGEVAQARVRAALPQEDYDRIKGSLENIFAGKGTPQEIQAVLELLIANTAPKDRPASEDDVRRLMHD